MHTPTGNLSELETLRNHGTSVLGPASLALGLVSNVASGVLNVPGLQPAAEVALQIFHVLKVFTS